MGRSGGWVSLIEGMISRSEGRMKAVQVDCKKGNWEYQLLVLPILYLPDEQVKM